MFPGFARQRLPTRDTDIHLRLGGAGPPLLLIHGYPQTHVAWHKVAPHLAESFTVVVPDLRGYGDSAAPEPDPQHVAYSKRAMAQDLVEVMTALGFDHFGLAGHDRGGRVAYRLALDHPTRVRRLAVCDMVPTLDETERTDWRLAWSTYHWFFLAQPAPLPETLIGQVPDFYVQHTLHSWVGKPEAIAPEAMAEYVRCFRRPTVIRATCEDYRAGLSVDLTHDRADRERRARACAVRSSRSGAHRASPRTSWRCGAAGPMRSRTSRSTPGTSSWKKPPRRWHWHWRSFSRRPNAESFRWGHVLETGRPHAPPASRML
jgi:haloacetate dehalogenase